MSATSVASASPTSIKFNRNYRLSVQGRGGEIHVIEPPFTMEFDISRKYYKSANYSSIRIYNLSAANRDDIRKNRWDYGDYRSIVLQAGYNNNLFTVFSGNVTQAWSVREGTNFITQMESFDGGFALTNGVFNSPIPANTSKKEAIKTIMSTSGAFPNVIPGAIGNYQGVSSRGNPMNGSPMDLLTDLTGGGAFIDNGKCYALQDNECLAGSILEISSASGLLGTPLLEESFLTFDMIFEPGVFVGQQVSLKSLTAANFNNFYKVISIKHHGVISESVCGDATTSIGLYVLNTINTVGELVIPTLQTVPQ